MSLVTSSFGHSARSLMSRVSSRPSVLAPLSTNMTSKNCSHSATGWHHFTRRCKGPVKGGVQLLISKFCLPPATVQLEGIVSPVLGAWDCKGPVTAKGGGVLVTSKFCLPPTTLLQDIISPVGVGIATALTSLSYPLQRPRE